MNEITREIFQKTLAALDHHAAYQVLRMTRIQRQESRWISLLLSSRPDRDSPKTLEKAQPSIFRSCLLGREERRRPDKAPGDHPPRMIQSLA